MFTTEVGRPILYAYFILYEYGTNIPYASCVYLYMHIGVTTPLIHTLP